MSYRIIIQKAVQKPINKLSNNIQESVVGCSLAFVPPVAQFVFSIKNRNPGYCVHKNFAQGYVSRFGVP